MFILYWIINNLMTYKTFQIFEPCLILKQIIMKIYIILLWLRLTLVYILLIRGYHKLQVVENILEK